MTGSGRGWKPTGRSTASYRDGEKSGAARQRLPPGRTLPLRRACERIARRTGARKAVRAGPCLSGNPRRVDDPAASGGTAWASRRSLGRNRRQRRFPSRRGTNAGGRARTERRRGDPEKQEPFLRRWTNLRRNVQQIAVGKARLIPGKPNLDSTPRTIGTKTIVLMVLD